MNVFDSIMSAIFGHAAATQTQQQRTGIATPAQPAHDAAAVAGAAVGTATRPVAAAQPVDVEAVLTERAKHKTEHLNWRQSIVDLLKVLDLDSSLGARKQLAHELGYQGELNGSAEMNIWLHKHVMQKLAANGGKVPQDMMS